MYLGFGKRFHCTSAENLSKITHISLVSQGLDPIQDYSDGFSCASMCCFVYRSGIGLLAIVAIDTGASDCEFGLVFSAKYAIPVLAERQIRRGDDREHSPRHSLELARFTVSTSLIAGIARRAVSSSPLT